MINMGDCMYKINYKLVRTSSIFGYIFFGIGLFILIVMGSLSFFIINPKGNYEGKTTATDISTNCKTEDDGYMCAPIYKYEVNGITYTYKSNTYSNVEDFPDIIYYDINNPENATSKWDKQFGYFLLLFLIIPIIFIIIGLCFIIPTEKRVKKLKHLSQYGTLYKNLPYQINGSNVSINGRQLPRVEVKFQLPTGEEKIYKGSPRMDFKTQDEDGYVDLLLDMENPDNYYLDFNIEQI